MPVVAHSALPTFAALREEGLEVLSRDEAERQDIRELHVGLLNLMPDAALEVTERQFVRLLGRANRIVQVFVHLFTVDGLDRGPQAGAHVDAHYESFADLRRQGLDGLVVSGANVTGPVLAEQPFYEPLREVMGWAAEEVTSTLCSCLASHALLEQRHGLARRRLQAKRWGVLDHRVVDAGHPLVAGTNTRFAVPHSRWNDVSVAQVRGAGLRVVVETDAGDLHLATSADGLRTVFLQGHPEYDLESLLKEHKRELARFGSGELDELPPVPEGYLGPVAARVVTRHVEDLVSARAAGRRAPAYPETELRRLLANTWADTASAVFHNWLGLVYRTTSLDRRRPFMDGVDPSDPLGLLARAA